MSWGEVTKINSDLTTPLNALLWVNDLKTYGKESYVYNSGDILMELAKYSIAINDPICRSLIIDGLHTRVHIGEFFKGYLNSDNPEFDNVRFLSDFAKVDSLVTEVFSNNNLATLVYASSSFSAVAHMSDTSISDVLYSNDAFTDGLMTRKLYVGEAGYASSVWVNILDRTDFIDKLLLPENRSLLKLSMGAGASGGTILEGLCRSPKGLNRFLKSQQPPDVVILMYSKYTKNNHGTALYQTLSSTLYFSLRADQWNTSISASSGATTYFNDTYPRGSSSISMPATDTSFALIGEVWASASATGNIKRISDSNGNWITYTNSHDFPANNVAIGGFMVEPPSPTGYGNVKYRMYVPK